MAGFAVPQWSDLAGGLRPEQREPEDHEPGSSRAGWQHEASRRVEQDFRASCLFPHMSPSERGAGVALLTSPSSPPTRIESPLFRVLLLRGFAEKLVGASLPTCSCPTWIWGCRGQEKTGPWRLSWMVCLFMAVPSWQLTPRWSLHSRAMGEPRRGAADHDGVALAAARRDKERTYPELVRPGARARGSRSGSGRQMVRGTQDLCAVDGKGSGQIRTTTHATSR